MPAVENKVVVNMVDDENQPRENVLLGVTAREGCGVFREGGSVACWGAVVQSARAEMDRFAVFSKGDTVCAGVFDGHGVKGSANWGAQLAEAAAEQLVSDAEPLDLEGIARRFEAFQSSHEANFDATISLEIDESRAAFQAEHGFSPGGRVLPSEGGTTATVVRIEREQLLVAWVGDSRAVLATDDEGGVRATALTCDHNVTANPQEQVRCEAAGAHCAGLYLGCDGADGLLQVTRSLGDRAHHLNGVLLATPELGQHLLTPTDAFAIIASDGVWHTVDDASAVALVDASLKGARGADVTPAAAQAACAALASHAKAACGPADVAEDDTTVVLLIFTKVHQSAV